MDTLSSFLKLRELDWDIYLLEDDLRRLPNKIEKSNKTLEKRKLQIKEYKDQTQRIKLKIREQEGVVSSIEDAIGKKKIQLNQTKSNKEYSSLLLEIDQKKAEIVQVEETILETMEKVEERATILEEQGKIFQEMEEKHKELENEVNKELADTQEKLKKVQEERKELAAGISDRETLEQYNKLLISQKGRALNPVEEGVCGHCHVLLFPGTLSNVKAGKIVFCQTCGSMLYAGKNA